MSPATTTKVHFVFRDGPLPPLKATVRGVEYELAPIKKAVFKKFREAADRMESGDHEAMFEQVKIVLPSLPEEVLDDLELRELNEFVNWLSFAVNRPPLAGLTEAEKNAPEPGQPTSP